MAFILEKISEEDMKKYGLESKLLEKISEEGMKLGLNLTRGCGPNREYMIRSGASGNWAVDKERGVFLIKVNSNGYVGVGMYELHYPNKCIVNFDAEKLAGSVANEHLNNPKFSLLSLRVPFSLKDNIELVKLDITESLNTFGYFSNPEIKEGDAKVTLLDNSKIQFKSGE